MRLIELVVPSDEAELAADRLWCSGAGGVEELDGEHGTSVVRTVLAADDALSIERLGPLPARWEVRFVDVEDAPSESWRDHARPIVVNSELTVAPAWVDVDAGPGTTVVRIEPAGSFGLGDHPTTRLSADAMWRTVSPGDQVLDVGCGSGVLAIIAVLRGADRSVAVDIAEAAREATVANSERNGVGARVEASCTPLGEVEGHFDVVAANILAPTLIELADDLERVLAPAGRLLISGILAGRHDHVLEALAPLTPVRTDESDSWACVELVAPSGARDQLAVRARTPMGAIRR